MGGAEEAAARPRRVLVVDDEEPIRLVVSAILEEEGYVVESGVNGEALALAWNDPPDLVLLDIMMPRMDGPEVRRQLLQHPNTAAVPIVVMTAAGDASSWAKKLGAAGAIDKPFNVQQLLRLVDQVVAGERV